MESRKKYCLLFFVLHFFLIFFGGETGREKEKGIRVHFSRFSLCLSTMTYESVYLYFSIHVGYGIQLLFESLLLFLLFSLCWNGLVGNVWGIYFFMVDALHLVTALPFVPESSFSARAELQPVIDFLFSRAAECWGTFSHPLNDEKVSDSTLISSNTPLDESMNDLREDVDAEKEERRLRAEDDTAMRAEVVVFMFPCFCFQTFLGDEIYSVACLQSRTLTRYWGRSLKWERRSQAWISIPSASLY